MGKGLQSLSQQTTALAVHAFGNADIVIDKENLNLNPAITDMKQMPGTSKRKHVRELTESECRRLFCKSVENEAVRRINEYKDQCKELTIDQQVGKVEALLESFDNLADLYLSVPVSKDENENNSDKHNDVSDCVEIHSIKCMCDLLREQYRELSSDPIEHRNIAVTKKVIETDLEELKEEVEQILLKMHSAENEFMQVKAEIKTSKSTLLSIEKDQSDVEKIDREILDLQAVRTAQVQQLKDLQCTKDKALIFDNDPEFDILLNQLELYKKKCADFEEGAKSFENEKKYILATLDGNNNDAELLMQELADRQSKYVTIENDIVENNRYADGVLNKLDGVIENSLKSAGKDSQAWGMAIALKILNKHNGEVLLKELKEELKSNFDNDSGRVLQIIYSLSGLKIITIDRQIPNRVLSLI